MSGTVHRPALPALLLACALAAACGGGDPVGGDAVPLSQAPGGAREAPAPAAQDPALTAYYEAKRCVGADDLEGAKAALLRATELDPQFAEAWYQLGATESNLAIRTVNYDESLAVQLFRDGVDHKRTAGDLMRAGATRVWTPPQLSQAADDLEQGLEGVDELLADEALLISTLKLYAASGS